MAECGAGRGRADENIVIVEKALGTRDVRIAFRQSAHDVERRWLLEPGRLSRRQEPRRGRERERQAEVAPEGVEQLAESDRLLLLDARSSALEPHREFLERARDVSRNPDSLDAWRHGDPYASQLRSRSLDHRHGGYVGIGRIG